MNPAAIELLKNLAVTGASLYMQSKDKADDMKAIAAIANSLTVVTKVFTEAHATLQKAHDEGWADADIRWVPVFAAGDAILAELDKRMT